MDKILIFDFGGQTCQLIARRIREIGVYTDIVPGDSQVNTLDLNDVTGIVLSGSPYSVYEEGAPVLDNQVLELGLPVLGICYGAQRTVHDSGGHVAQINRKEYGRSKLQFVEKSSLFENVPDGFVSWMSHGDTVDQLGNQFHLVAQSEHSVPAAFKHNEKEIYGIQFHPEVTHCEYGNTILENFAVGICNSKKEWTLEHYIDTASDRIREHAGEQPVLLLISGGVDSTVVAGMLLHALPPEQVHLMYIDTGLMRKYESEKVASNLKELGAKNLYIIDAETRFLEPLTGVSDPEEKRRIIGDTFIHVQEEEIAARNIENSFLAQGTLYTDLIESGKGIGKKAHVIKSHHNVRSPMVEKKRAEGKIIEPLDMLYKDEVRALGRKLGISESIISRHPFPGPGLGVRILGDVTHEKCEILREADHIYLSELKSRGLYDEIWQAFAVLLPVRSVGVTGDARDYSYVLALRAVCSHDGMTADVYPFPTKDLLEISAKITNQVSGVGRVVYDVSSKPPSTIEWE